MLTDYQKSLLNTAPDSQETDYTDYTYDYNNDEMYSYSNYKKKKNKKKNTFQQSSQPPVLNANVETPSALPSLPSAAASQPGMNPLEKDRIYGREAKKDDYFVEIRAQLSHPKVGKVTRATMYFSMKTDTDPKYNIFLRSKLTSANNETMRSILGHQNYVLKEKLEEIMAQGYDELWTGRIQYKPTNGFITQQHRKAHKYGLCAVFKMDGEMYSFLYFNGETYPFQLEDTLTATQAKHYCKEGLYVAEEGECE